METGTAEAVVEDRGRRLNEFSERDRDPPSDDVHQSHHLGCQRGFLEIRHEPTPDDPGCGEGYHRVGVRPGSFPSRSSVSDRSDGRHSSTFEYHRTHVPPLFLSGDGCVDEAHGTGQGSRRGTPPTDWSPDTLGPRPTSVCPEKDPRVVGNVGSGRGFPGPLLSGVGPVPTRRP